MSCTSLFLLTERGLNELKKKIVLNFPPGAVTKPITYHLVKDFNLVINILYAKIQRGEKGVLVLEVRGRKESFQEALKFLERQNIQVQLLAQDIDLDVEKCVECGLCTGVCPTEALYLDSEWHICFDKDRCILCENCIETCPTRAVVLKI